MAKQTNKKKRTKIIEKLYSIVSFGVIGILEGSYSYPFRIHRELYMIFAETYITATAGIQSCVRLLFKFIF